MLSATFTGAPFERGLQRGAAGDHQIPDRAYERTGAAIKGGTVMWIFSYPIYLLAKRFGKRVEFEERICYHHGYEFMGFMYFDPPEDT